MDSGWIAFNTKSKELLHLSRNQGWEVEPVRFDTDDLFGHIAPQNMEPIEYDYDPSMDMAGFVAVYDKYLHAVANSFSPDIDEAINRASELERRASRAKLYWQNRRRLQQGK